MNTPLLRINRDAPRKPRINLYEAELVKAAVLAAGPQTTQQLDSVLAGIRAYGPLIGRCLQDETHALRPHLLALLIQPRLSVRPTIQLA